ncbi:hypothetical protein B0H11DRAFT_2124580 [Mycena galericulata]|nr:hypothetical protein B0H11DRAFT_2124580 [Mycena galericulata]
MVLRESRTRRGRNPHPRAVHRIDAIPSPGLMFTKSRPSQRRLLVERGGKRARALLFLRNLRTRLGNSPARDASGEGLEKRGRMACNESGRAGDLQHELHSLNRALLPVAHQFRALARLVVVWPVCILPRTRRSQPCTPCPRRIRIGGARAASVRVPVETRESLTRTSLQLPPKFLVFNLYRILQAVNRLCQRRVEFVRCCNRMSIISQKWK